MPSLLPAPLIIDDVEMGYGGGGEEEKLPSYEDGEDTDGASSDRAAAAGSTPGGSSPPSVLETAEEREWEYRGLASGVEEQDLGERY